MNENGFIPKYEFRIFGQSFGRLEEVILQKASFKKEQFNEEIYLLTAVENENNVKIRNGKMDMKILEEHFEGLEHWTQYMIGDFPMSKEVINNTVFPALGIPAPTFEREEYTLQQFLNELVYFDPDLFVAYTMKHHRNFFWNQCEIEITQVWVNGAYIKTLCIESPEYEHVLRAKKALYIDDGEENVNYPKALKRIMGLEKLPQSWVENMKSYLVKSGKG